MRTRRFLQNSAATALAQLVLLVTGFITPRIMLKYYGSEVNGLVTSINQFITYIHLVEAGISAAAIYSLYKPLADKNHGAINAVLAAARNFYARAGYIFVSLTVGLALTYPVLIKSEAVEPLYIGLLVLILGVNGALEFFTLGKYRVLLSADQKSYVVSLATIVHLIVNAVIVVVFGTMQVDIVLLRLLALASIFVRSFILMIYVRSKYPFVDYSVPPDNGALSKRWDAFYLQILGAVQSGAPVVILTAMTANLKLVSVFVVFNMVLAGLAGVMSIFMSGLSASFGEVLARKETEVLRKAYLEFEFVYYGLVAASHAAVMVLLMPFIRLYTRGVTDITYDVPLYALLFVINGLLYTIKTPQGMLVLSAGLFKETRVQTTIQAALAVVLGAALAPFLGITGVLLGMIASNLYRAVDLNFFIHRRVTGLPLGRSFLRMLVVLALVLPVYLPFHWLRLAPSGYLELLGWAALVGLWALVVVGLAGWLLDRSSCQAVVRRLKQVVGR